MLYQVNMTRTTFGLPARKVSIKHSARTTRLQQLVVRSSEKEINSKVTEAIQEAEEVCDGGDAAECSTAWDTVEELSAAAKDQAEKEKSSDPLEEYCESAPDADECRVYED